MAEVSQPDPWGGPDSLRSTPPVVLLADDQVEFRTTVAFHLAMAGYPVVQAGSMAGVVARSRDVRPDLLILSDDLGNGNVGDLLDTIAHQADLNDVPVITLSSRTGTERLVECLSHGARDHVRRQDGADELIARIDAVLRTDDELERLRRRNAELEFLGTVDPITGMANRRHVEEEFDRLAAGATRHDLALSAVMIRVDELPPPRSAASRLRQQEAVLRELAFLLAAVRRTDDFSGVWDDRTFVALLPVTRIDGAKAFAERLRAVVKAAPVRSGDELLTVTISASCAEVGPEAAGILRRLELGVMSVQAAGGDGMTVAG